MGKVGIDIAALQATDLSRGLEHIRQLTDANSMPLICANLVDSAGRLVFPAYRVFDFEGHRLGVLAVVHPRQQNFLDKMPHDLRFTDPRPALEEAVRALRGKENCQAVVALIGARRAGAKDLASGLPGIDLIFFGNAANSLPVPVETDQGTPMTTAAARGREFGEIVLTLRDDGSVGVGPMAVHELTRHYDDEPDILAEVQAFQKQEQDRVRQARALQVLAAEFAEQEALDNYLGSERCGNCHGAIHKAFSADPHAHALTSLEASLSENDPACVSCHVTGWGRANGYGQMELELRDLGQVQCEACHGYGTAHTRDGSMRPVARQSCAACHRAELPDGCGGAPRAGDFDYESAWKKIAH